MIIDDINKLSTTFLIELEEINAFIGYNGDVFGGTTEDEQEDQQDDWEFQSEGAGACIEGRNLNGTVSAKVNNWNSHTICLTGISFNEPINLVLSNNESYVKSFPATVTNGVGARYLYEALGKRTLTVEIASNYNEIYYAGSDFSDISFFEIMSVSVNFLNETAAELDAIYNMLKKQYASFEREMTASRITRRYKNFYKLTGLDKEDCFKKYVKNNNFDDLFDEG